MTNNNADNQQLDSFFEFITRLPIMAHAIDKEGILLNVSDFWLKKLGYEREEVIGQHSVTFLTEESRKHAEQKALPEYFAKGFIENVYYQFLRKDNTKIDVLLSANSLYDKEDAFLCSLATIVDITEKKRSEELLQESEARYKNLVNNIPGTTYQLVMSADGQFRFDYLSDNCLDLFGYSGEEIKNDARLIFDNIPQPNADEVIQAIERSASTCTPYRLNHRFIKKDRERIWIYASSIPRKLPDGAIIWDGIGLDITEQKQSENEKDIIRKILFEAEKLANVGGWEWDVEKDKWTMSENWLRIHGCTEKHLSTSELIAIAHPDDRRNIQDAFERAVERGTPYEFEHRIIRKDTGEERYIKAYGTSKKDQAGKPVKLYGAAQDITEIKHITEELKKSQERFELAMEASQDGLYDWNLMSNEIFYSPGWKRMLGYRADELPNDFSVWEELTEPEDRRRSWEMQHELVSKKRHRFELEFKMKHKDGHWVDILSRATAVFGDDGRAVRIIGTHVDITERKRWEMAVKRQNTLLTGINRIFGAVVTSADDKEFGAICLDVAEEITGSSNSFLGEIDPDGMLHDIALSNPTWNACSVFNSGKIPKNFHTYGIYARVIVNGLPLLINNPASPPASVVLPTGHPPLTSLLATPLKHGEKTIGMVAVGNREGGYGREDQADLEILCRMITESLARRRAEEALREGEVRYRSLFMHSPDAIYINQQDRITLVNDACLKLFGARTAGELIGKTPYDLVHADYHQVIRERIQRLRHQGEAQPLLEEKIIRLDGGIVDVEATAAHFPFGGSSAIHVILRDITERKQATENLQRSNKELEQFAYAASHDLQEPLRSIIGFLQLLQLHYGDQLDEKGQQYIERVMAASHRMQSMIRDLLSLSRVTTSNGTFLLTSLNSLVKSVLDNLESTLQENHAEVVCADLPSLLVDSSQIQRLFQNLILNGIKYNTNPNPRIEIGRSLSGNVYQFFVKDNGIGISPKFYERIFMVFQRLHTAKEYDGTGLGLALCRKIVERHGGKIWVESVPGEGSTFHFTLPVSDKS